MKNYIKMGFGVTIGTVLAKCTLKVIEGVLATKVANNEEIMTELKEKDPDHYEKLKKYIIK